MLGHVGAIFAIDWAVIGGPGSDIGGKLGPESDKMVHSQLGSQAGRTEGGGWYFHALGALLTTNLLLLLANKPQDSKPLRRLY